MSSVKKQISRLNAIANGPGAVRLPSNIVGINLQIRSYTDRQVKGAKSFWRNNLPQVQFHNPSLPITVKKITPEQEASGEKPLLNIIFQDGSSKYIETKERTSEQILEDFINLSGASRVPDEEIPILKTPSFHGL